MLDSDTFYYASCDSCDVDFSDDSDRDGDYTVHRTKEELEEALTSADWAEYKGMCLCQDCFNKEAEEDGLDISNLSGYKLEKQ